MRVAFDTNRYSDLARGVPDAIDVLRTAEQVILPFIVLAELRAGFQHGSRGPENERQLLRFLGSPRVSVLYADDGTTHQYARLYVQLRRQGTPIPTNDLWIAALVLEHQVALYARDQHYSVIPQLHLL